MHIRHGAYACQAQVYGAKHSEISDLGNLCNSDLICEFGIDMFV